MIQVIHALICHGNFSHIDQGEGPEIALVNLPAEVLCIFDENAINFVIFIFHAASQRSCLTRQCCQVNMAVTFTHPLKVTNIFAVVPKITKFRVLLYLVLAHLR